jgi:hypothetical protein
MAQNQDNVSEWGDMSILGLLFQWTNTIKIQLGEHNNNYIIDVVSNW